MDLRKTPHDSSSNSSGIGKKPRGKSRTLTTSQARVTSRANKVPPYSYTEYSTSDVGQARSMNPVKLSRRRYTAGKIVSLGIALFVVLCAVLAGAELVLNSGKVHYGVTVEGVDIGGMTEQEAAATLEAALNERLESAVFVVTPDADTLARLENGASEPEETDEEGASTEEDVSADDAASANDEVITDDTASADDAASALSWVFTSEELGITLDADALVEQALSVGQPDGLDSILSSIQERFFCWFGGIELSANEGFRFDEDLLASALGSMNSVLGISMINCSITVDAEGIVSVVSGQAGEQVDQEAFEAAVVAAVLGKSSASFDILMEEVPLVIDEEKAQAAADLVNEALSLPVTLEYKEQTWELTAAQMGAWVSTEVSGEGDEAELAVSLDRVAAYEGIQEVLGSVGYGTAVNASFDVRSGTPVITGGTSGIGPDISAGVTELEELLFGSTTTTDITDEAGTTDEADLASSRTIVLEEGIVLPEITIEDAAEMGVNELIASYTISYGSNNNSAQTFNIKRCLDAINGILLAPGETWDWNTELGSCDESSGYKVAAAVVSGNVVQTAGGGIDDVATCLFNAVYEAGLAIGERTSSSMVQLHYPVGRDAMIAWGSATLSFTNDTENYLLISASYDDTSITISVWGTDEDRTVASSYSGWSSSGSGYSLTTYRTVYAADGSVLHQDSFSSYYISIEQEEEDEEEDEPAEETGSS